MPRPYRSAAALQQLVSFPATVCSPSPCKNRIRIDHICMPACTADCGTRTFPGAPPEASRLPVGLPLLLLVLLAVVVVPAHLPAQLVAQPLAVLAVVGHHRQARAPALELALPVLQQACRRDHQGGGPRRPPASSGHLPEPPHNLSGPAVISRLHLQAAAGYACKRCN